MSLVGGGSVRFGSFHSRVVPHEELHTKEHTSIQFEGKLECRMNQPVTIKYTIVVRLSIAHVYWILYQCIRDVVLYETGFVWKSKGRKRKYITVSKKNNIFVKDKFIGENVINSWVKRVIDIRKEVTELWKGVNDFSKPMIIDKSSMTS